MNEHVPDEVVPTQYMPEEPLVKPIEAPKPSYEDTSIERLKKENIEKQIAFDKQREIQQLLKENKRLEDQSKQMTKAFTPRFNISKEKARFYAIAAVVAITVAVVIVKILQRVF